MNPFGDTAYADCKNCQILYRRAEKLRRRNQQLERELKRERALRARAEQRARELEQAPRTLSPATASNSSLPPSANPIGAKPPVKKKPTGRRPGGQIGHVGKSRQLLPVEQMHQLIPHRPSHCQHCHEPLGASGEDQLLGRHQVAELPAVAVVMTEHQSYACRCGKCGAISRGRIPAEVAASSTGPRLTATIGLLGAWVKGSRRAVAEVIGQVLGCPMALGSVMAREAELSAALAKPYEQLVAAVAGAKVKYVDETGWKRRGQSRWLFVAATSREAVFRVESTRTHPAFLRLLGGQVSGVFCTDRCGIYDLLPLKKRGVCWAHLKRDFVAVVERGGVGIGLGEEGLKIVGKVFDLWRELKARQISRKQLQEQIKPLQEQMHTLLEQGAGCGQKKTTGLCRGLLKLESALWRFAEVPGLAPDNNLAERMLRPAVIWRKKSFGCHSEAGCLYVERMLSVIQSLRLRGQDVLEYLAKAVTAYRRGEEAPSLSAGRRGPAPKPPSNRRGSVLPDDLRKVA